VTIAGEKLSSGIGFEVRDIDVRELDADGAEAIRRLWDEHLVLLFRGQTLNAEEQVAFSSLFGSVRGTPEPKHTDSIEERYTAIVGNRSVNGRAGVLPEGEMWFHYDQMYRREPVAAAILYGLEIPSRGGNTLFANAAAAYDDLPEELRRRLVKLTAEHIYDYRATTRNVTQAEPDAMSFVHPLVVQHPRTGRCSLFVSRLMTSRIIELEPDESRTLLERLFAHLEDRRYIYEHRWRPGDLLVWDNTSVLHARTDFDPREPRILRRVSLERPDTLHPPAQH
jgi:taurine dioxygenase